MGKSTAARLAELERRGAELAGADPTAGAPSPVHAEAVNVMADLLSMAQRYSNGPTPPHMRALLRMLEAGRPMLVEQLATVPADAIRTFMGELIARMQRIVDAPGE